ncbi:MAG: alpha-ketoacid dehydrogenase subunit beta [Acidimicrobiia bacterium]|nr:alpha-ketoacid dehydrogenase subunit beta [Acidimicrobiia bacterium]MXZ78309.1 alpha-ketoacid dehydrogenase subunit beta [Acidimicrobiia bacterium]MYB73778.1 alpha-ketoacid dehydrogenase subunit beta [Acidimicrobiia bacterium]MYE74150.1 alpha-ketoacid dehydrogenase subunit beta [Acidimicrobiia bacterium]MYH99802.1 alpha-ketoacid dehydrogenase subunit beta [Acidimicrobiia bacterium]
MRTVSYIQAVTEAMTEEMERDESVFIMGEDVAWNMMGDCTGMVEKFGVERVRNTPISEAGFVGAGAGAAMVGMRPIVHMLIAPFMYVAFDQIVSIIAKSTYTYGGQARLPITLRAPMMYGVSNAAQHSDRPYATLMTIPGLKLIAPATPHDAKGMLKAAIRDDNPVITFEDRSLWGQSSEVPDGELIVPLGQAAVRREGTDVTVVTVAGAITLGLAAAEQLASEGVSAEVIDLRSIVPMDTDTILESVAKTGRLLIADPAHEMGSVASEISAVVAQHGFWSLQAPIARVTTPHTHMPFNADLEKVLLPNTDKIVAEVRALME